MPTGNYTGYNKKSAEFARRLRKSMTKEERRLWYDFLSGYSVKIYRQRPIDKYIADFYCSAAKLVIEIDGGQHYTDEELKHDAKRTEVFNEYGIDVIRFTNVDVNYKFAEVCSAVDYIIQSRIGERKQQRES